jgi:hypothetical protein
MVTSLVPKLRYPPDAYMDRAAYKIGVGCAQARILLASPRHRFQPAHHAAERHELGLLTVSRTVRELRRSGCHNSPMARRAFCYKARAQALQGDQGLDASLAPSETSAKATLGLSRSPHEARLLASFTRRAEYTGICEPRAWPVVCSHPYLAGMSADKWTTYGIRRRRTNCCARRSLRLRREPSSYRPPVLRRCSMSSKETSGTPF